MGARPATARPKTGEKRKTHQPLKIDRLPVAMQDRIRQERIAGRSWHDIERISPKFKEWEDVTGDVRKLFPGQHFPHTNLARWYDIRCAQRLHDVEIESVRAREIATAFTGRGVKDLDEAVRNALADQIFLLVNSAEPKDAAQFRKELLDLGLLLTKCQKAELDKAKLAIENAKLEAQRARDESGLDPRELYLNAAQDVLKKLLTRKAVRDVIDPIKEELISEFAHGAEAYAKRVEA